MGMNIGMPVVAENLMFSIDAADSTLLQEAQIWGDYMGKKGSLLNSPIFSEEKLGVFNFDGVNEKCEVSTDIVFENNTTWESWINCTANKDGAQYWLGKHLPFFSFTQENTIEFSNSINSIQRSIYTENNIPQNQWIHVVGTTEYISPNTTMRLWINGILISQESFSGTQTNYSTQKLTIGDNYATSNPFTGKISNIKIYNMCFSEQQIIQNYQAILPRYIY